MTALAYLHCFIPWQVSGSLLDPLVTIKFLSALPLGRSEASSFVSDDLRYWSHLTRWCLDLLARGKFVPVVSADKNGGDRLMAALTRQRFGSGKAEGI